MSTNPRDYPGYRRTFVRTSKAFYAATELRDAPYADEVIVSLREPEEGGMISEFVLRWCLLIGAHAPRPPLLRLECYAQSFPSLAACADSLRAIASLPDERPDPDRVEEVLLSLGFEDETPRERPS